MKKILLICLITCNMVCFTHAYAKSNEQPLDQTVAIVNDDVISRSELDHAIANAKMQVTQEHAELPSDNALQKQVLDKLINKKIQLQIATQTGLKITNAELNKTIEHIAKQNHLDLNSLYERLHQDGITTAEYRDEIRDQMTLQRLQQQEVASKMSISPEEITEFMHSGTGQTNNLKEYHLQDILIPFSDTPSMVEMDSVRKHANEVMAMIHQGQDFDKIASSEAGNNQTLQGGDLGWRKLPEIPPAFADQVVHMKAKAVAGPIQTPNGFHIIRLVETRALNAKDAAISRKMIESQLMQAKFEEAVQNWVSKLRSQAFVVINA